jgi:hypothetical protein
MGGVEVKDGMYLYLQPYLRLPTLLVRRREDRFEGIDVVR